VLILEILYLLTVVLLAVYGLNSLLLTWLYRRKKQQTDATRLRSADCNPHSLALSGFPYVTIQLPIYNEYHVVERLIEAAANLNWPVDRLQIQILDDSTDHTSQLVAAVLARQRTQNPHLDLLHIHRSDRRGYKAGALQAGLASATGEFIAIFDADFIPPPGFLQEAVPLFGDGKVGCVQTRWGHLNPEISRLTQAQELGIDGHFVIEQTARHTIKAFLNFNGTAGVWRRACLDDAGGWQGDTLTEDLDLSYRAQFQGWRIVYQPQVIVPAELPVQIDALKRQQFRWAKGSMQTAIKLLQSLWRLPHPTWLKLMATLHLTNYAVHPLMLLNFLLTLPITLSNSSLLHYTPFFLLSAVGPPLLYWTAMQTKSWPLATRLSRLGLLIALGTGLSVNNTRAVFEALLGINSEFKRTPKFAVIDRSVAWRRSSYILPRDPSTWVEATLALYALGLLGWVVLAGLWLLIPWLLIYLGGYSYIATLTFVQARQTRAARAQARPRF
jgi:cellulose synthase/poly-beta-1,6-N-acetylglucosamine synthase-like glycosyltransferase